MAADPYIVNYDQTLSEFGLAQSRLWPSDTLCITIAGANTARTAILKFQACFPDSIIGFRPNPSVANIHFIKYSLDFMKHRFLAITRGATQDNLSLDKLLSFPIPIPPLETQRRIASILSAYDDLIEVHTRRIAIFEEMARRLYDEWFIKFRFPGHTTTTFVETAKGCAPAGWPGHTLSDLLELRYGKALKANERVSGPFPVYGSSGIVGWHNKNLVEGPGIIVGRKGNVGSVHWSREPFYPIDTVFYVHTSWPKTFVFYVLQSQNFLNSDSAVPGLNKSQAIRASINLPPMILALEFHRYVNEYFQFIEKLRDINKNLRATRDLLLPKLISGEIDLSGAEHTANGAAERVAAE
jgi:type I restriction enzyme S subunit